MMNDFRALCSELAAELRLYKIAHPMHEESLLDRARAALAEGEAGPSDEELLELAEQYRSDGLIDLYSARDFARAVLARYSAARPIPAAERLPGPSDEAAKLAVRIRHFIQGYMQMRGLDPEHVYSIHRGDAMEAHITISDLTLAAQLLGGEKTRPVPVSERPPGPEDCDAEGRCWLLLIDADSGAWCWILDRPDAVSTWAHWLPAHALPIPENADD